MEEVYRPGYWKPMREDTNMWFDRLGTILGAGNEGNQSTFVLVSLDHL